MRPKISTRSIFSSTSMDGTLNIEYGLVPLPLPKSLTLLKEVKLSSYPITVDQYKGSIYVGLDNKTIAKIDSNYQVQESFITCGGDVESIVVYKDKIYTLLCMWDSSPRGHVVCVYDMSGRHITQWGHVYHSYFCKKMIIVADQVLIADQSNARITVYSLTGQTIKQIPCSAVGSGQTVLCPLDNTSIVVSDLNLS